MTSKSQFYKKEKAQKISPGGAKTKERSSKALNDIKKAILQKRKSEKTIPRGTKTKESSSKALNDIKKSIIRFPLYTVSFVYDIICIRYHLYTISFVYDIINFSCYLNHSMKNYEFLDLGEQGHF